MILTNPGLPWMVYIQNPLSKSGRGFCFSGGLPRVSEAIFREACPEMNEVNFSGVGIICLKSSLCLIV